MHKRDEVTETLEQDERTRLWPRERRFESNGKYLKDRVNESDTKPSNHVTKTK